MGTVGEIKLYFIMLFKAAMLRTVRRNQTGQIALRDRYEVEIYRLGYLLDIRSVTRLNLGYEHAVMRYNFVERERETYVGREDEIDLKLHRALNERRQMHQLLQEAFLPGK